MTISTHWFTFHAGRLCGGRRGFLFRWFGTSDVVQWQFPKEQA